MRRRRKKGADIKLLSYTDYVIRENIEDLKECINTFRKRLGNKTVDEYLELLENKKYEVLVEKYLISYYDPLYMHSIKQYKYNDIIKFEDANDTIKKSEFGGSRGDAVLKRR